MTLDELYMELRRIISEETDIITERCMKLITEYTTENKPVPDSIEDMLSYMSDDSEKEKHSEPAEFQRPLTKAELREKKKQEKIDAKFIKDLAKKGF